MTEAKTTDDDGVIYRGDEDDPPPVLDVKPIYPGLVFAEEQTRIHSQPTRAVVDDDDAPIGAGCPPPRQET